MTKKPSCPVCDTPLILMSTGLMHCPSHCAPPREPCDHCGNALLGNPDNPTIFRKRKVDGQTVRMHEKCDNEANADLLEDGGDPAAEARERAYVAERIEGKFRVGVPVCAQIGCLATATTTRMSPNRITWVLCAEHAERDDDPFSAAVAGIPPAKKTGDEVSLSDSMARILAPKTAKAIDALKDYADKLVASLTPSERRILENRFPIDPRVAIVPDAIAKLACHEAGIAPQVDNHRATTSAERHDAAQRNAAISARVRGAKSPRCFDCGGLHPEGDCLVPKVMLAAERAAGALTEQEQAAIVSLVDVISHMRGQATLGQIAGLFERAATRIEALTAARMNTPWYVTAPDGLAVCCRRCGLVFTAPVDFMPAACPSPACCFVGGEITS